MDQRTVKQPDYFEQIVKILKLVTLKGQEIQQNKPQIFNEILKLMKKIVDLKETGQKNLYMQYIQRFQAEESIILWFRNYLNDSKAAIRLNSIKFLRYLIEDKNSLIIYRQRGIHYFIARSLERDVRQDRPLPPQQQQTAQQQAQQFITQEVLQALKFIHKWLEVNQVKFPKVLGNALTSFAESCGDSMRRYAVITLRLFALNQPEVCGWCGGIRLLIEAAVDPQVSDLSDQIVWSLLYLLNEPNTRSSIRVYLDFSRWFSIFTEIDPPIDQKQDKQKIQQNRFEAQLNLSKKALISVLKSWQGLIYLGNERQALHSLIDALRQPIKSTIRQAIYEILKELLALGSKENTGVSVAHRTNEAPQHALAKTSDYKINNLLNNYLVMLVQVLLDCGLFKVLVELSGLEDNDIASPAQRFLRELSGLMFNLIPDYHKYTDFLIAAANQNDPFLIDLKSWSSEIVNTMGNYAFDQDKRKKVQVSKFIYLTENLYQTMQLGLPSHKINNETVSIIRAQIEQEAEEARFQTLLKQSMVTSAKEESNKWNWDCILELFETFLNNNNQRFQEALKNKFLKTLLTYFYPYNMQFVVKDWKPENFIQAKCGYLLLKQLIKDSKGRELLISAGEGLLKINKTFYLDLKSLLQADLQMLHLPERNSLPVSAQSFLDPSPLHDEKVGNQILHSVTNLQQREAFTPQMNASQIAKKNHPAQLLLNADKYQCCMMREYMSWIGLLGSFKKGQQRLQSDGIYTILTNWVEKQGRRDHILIQLIHCLDYGKPGQQREFFEHCLYNGSRSLSRSCLDFLRLLYRTELQDYSEWAIDLLVNALRADDDSIAFQALSVTEEVTQDSDNMTRFIERVNLPRLLQLSKKAQSSFVITLLSHKQGFERALSEQQDFLFQELEHWKDEESLHYIERVEKVMCDALEFVQNEESSNLFKFPSLLTNMENSYGAIQFIYKMPWMMSVECSDVEGQLALVVTVDSVQSNKLLLCGRPLYTTDQMIESFTVNSNSQFVFKMHISVGSVFIDNNCKEVSEPYEVRCDFNDKKHLGVHKNDQLIIEKSGITFLFDLRHDSNKMRLSGIRVQFRMGDVRSSPNKMPPHIFGELAYTEKGYELLKENNYIDHFIQVIRSEKSEPQIKRSALWAIGHIGQSKHGAKYIREQKLIPDLVKVAEQCPVLSLRGTCLYTLNMICTTSSGRKELEKFGWVSHLNSNLGWLCTPKNIYQFFYIRQQLKENQRTYWAFQDEIWEKYAFVQKSIRLNLDSQKILETIALMSNQLTFKDAEREINKMRLTYYLSNQQNRSTKPSAFENIDLFHQVLLMFTFYKFKTAAKIKIYSYFDKIFTPTIVQQALESTVYQQVGCQDGTII